MTTNPECVPTYGGPLDFIFVVHPRTICDVLRAYPHLRGLDEGAIMSAVRPFSVSILSPISVESNGRRLNGELVSIPYLATEFRRNVREIQGALREVLAYAESRQTKVVGLGALIPSVSRYGADLLPHVRTARITSGHTYTAYALARHVVAVEKILGGPQPIAIVGAAGSIGRGTARALCAQLDSRNLLLVDIESRNQALQELRAELLSRGCRSVATSTELTSIRDTPVVVCATNATRAIIGAHHLRQGAIIIDDSQPPNITLETATEARVTVIKCLARVPSLRCPFDYGLFEPSYLIEKQNIVFTCLAETVMRTGIEKDLSAIPGASGIGIDFEEVRTLADTFGITIAPFHSFPEIGRVSLGI